MSDPAENRKEPKFHLEFATTGRARCKGCKEKILKQALRIGKTTTKSGEGEIEINSTQFYHVACFKVPAKYKKMSLDEFVTSVLNDRTGEIVSMRTSVVDELEKAKAKKRPRVEHKLLVEIRAAYEEREQRRREQQQEEAGEEVETETESEEDDDDNDRESPPKRAKLETKSTVSSSVLDTFATYKDLKVNELKDILRWNNQVVDGRKDTLIYKCMDGAIFGRLSRCEICGGKLMLLEDGTTVECLGIWDEETCTKQVCPVSFPPAEAPRWKHPKPWYVEEPCEEEAKEMAALIERYEEAGGIPAEGMVDPATKDDLFKAFAGMEFDLQGQQGIREASEALLRVFHSRGPLLDMPQDENQAKSELFSLISNHPDETTTVKGIVSLVIEHFGFIAEKKHKAKKKEKSVAALVTCPANANIVLALKELAELISKEGNKIAASNYNKAVFSLRKLEYEITAENAMGLSNGKTKLEGIGKKTSSLIHELVTTGSISKLEDLKRDDAS